MNHEDARKLRCLRRRGGGDNGKRGEGEWEERVRPFFDVFTSRVQLDGCSFKFYRAMNWRYEQETMEKNQELADKDIGTKMVHLRPNCLNLRRRSLVACG